MAKFIFVTGGVVSGLKELVRHKLVDVLGCAGKA